MPRFEGDVFRLGTAMMFPAFQMFKRIGKPGFVTAKWLQLARLFNESAAPADKCLHIKVPQRLNGVGCRIGRGYTVFTHKRKP